MTISVMAIRRVGVAAALAGVGLLVVGCSGESGTPRAQTTTSTTAAAVTSASSTSPSAGGDKFANIKPCELMSSSEAVALGISEAGKPETTAGDKGCDWKVSGSYGVLVTLLGSSGLKDLNHSGKTPVEVPIGKHKAIKVPDGAAATADSGDCNVYIDVTEKSSVGIFVSTIGARGTDLACQRAEQVAKYIDPKLP